MYLHNIILCASLCVTMACCTVAPFYYFSFCESSYCHFWPASCTTNRRTIARCYTTICQQTGVVLVPGSVLPKCNQHNDILINHMCTVPYLRGVARCFVVVAQHCT